MNLNELFCLNPSCPAKGQRGQGNIRPHSQQEQRCICTVCGDTFSTRKGTIFYGAQRAPGTDATVVILVLTLLAYGCPTQAAAIAFGLDERTVKRWWERAGKHSAFRSPLPRFGRPGRPTLVAWPNIAIVQVVKQHLHRTGQIERRIVQGATTLVDRLLQATQGGQGVINTAYIERFNATLCQRLHWLTRRTRTLAQQTKTLHAGLFIVGCLYNFCDVHESLRLKLSVGARRFRWVQRTPALVAHLTDHRWSPTELFSFRIPPERWSPQNSADVAQKPLSC